MDKLVVVLFEVGCMDAVETVSSNEFQHLTIHERDCLSTFVVYIHVPQFLVRVVLGGDLQLSVFHIVCHVVDAEASQRFKLLTITLKELLWFAEIPEGVNLVV